MPDDISRSVPKAIFGGATVAALLDIMDPIILYGLRGVPPIRILQSIVSGILGRAASSGGFRTVLLGLTAHLFGKLAILAAISGIL